MTEPSKEPPGLGAQRQRRVIVFADLVESVRLMQRHEADVIDRWRRFAAQVREQMLPAMGGRMVRTAGDGLLMAFGTAPAAAAAAHALHGAIDLYNADRQADDAMLLRIGIHVADVVLDEFEAYGSGVNLAARLTSLAQPGQTLVSAQTRDELVDGLHAQIDDLGVRYVKHIDEPIRAFRLRPQGAQRDAVRRLPLPSADDLRPAVAVVPFSLLPADAAYDALGHAMADDIIAALSRHPGLRVLSRASTAQLRGTLPGLPKLRELLGAAFLLTGQYYHFGARVRLNVELCHLESGEVLWTGNAAAEVDALFAGQDDLVPHIVANVSQRVLALELTRVRSLPMNTLASYSLYLGATGLMNSLVEADFMRSRTVLEHLVERHPRQAAPYAMMARWHVFRTAQGWSKNWRHEGLASQEQAKRALDLDPTNAAALSCDGLVRLHFENDIEGARARYLAAIDADPHEAHAWGNLASVHSFSGEHDAACTAADMALRLSPLDPNLFLFEAYAAMANLGAGRFDEAIKHAQSSIRHHAVHGPSYRLLITALWLGGQHADARLATARYLQIQPDAVVGAAWRAMKGLQPVWGAVQTAALSAAGLPG